MKVYTSDDYETPIGELPGIVGYTWDGEFFPQPALASLEGFAAILGAKHAHG